MVIGFGLRNVTAKGAALREMYRVLKPTGKALVLNFQNQFLHDSQIYDVYSFSVLPAMGYFYRAGQRIISILGRINSKTP